LNPSDSSWITVSETLAITATMFLNTAQGIVVGTGEGPYLSSDKGLTWQPRFEGIYHKNVKNVEANGK